MTRARVIRNLGDAVGHAEAVAKLKDAGDLVTDRRGIERSLVMLCPDGCGEVLTINLDRRSGKAWRPDRRGGKLTLYPSVWRDSGCGAHFIIWRDTILWCDWREGPDPQDTQLIRRVSASMSTHGSKFTHYETLAEEMGENPWDVSWACSVLQREGRAEEHARGHYRIRRAGSKTGTIDSPA